MTTEYMSMQRIKAVFSDPYRWVVTARQSSIAGIDSRFRLECPLPVALRSIDVRSLLRNG